jgi:hypothetical protein
MSQTVHFIPFTQKRTPLHFIPEHFIITFLSQNMCPSRRYISQIVLAVFLCELNDILSCFNDVNTSGIQATCKKFY